MARESCKCQWCAPYRRAFQGAGQRIVSADSFGADPVPTRMGDFGPEGVCRFASRSLLGHSFGAEPAPGGSSLFCFD